MSPLVHAELSWLIAARLEHRRDRLLVTLAGVVPDVDGLTLLAGEDAYARWHHVLTHGLVSAVAFAAVFGVLAKRRTTVALLTLLAFHVHLLCDLVGSGPGWGLSYWWPFSAGEFLWSGQWDLASWQNGIIGLAATLAVLWCSVPLGRTIVELFSVRADAKVVATVRARLGSRNR